jgi:hypothetical protein
MYAYYKTDWNGLTVAEDEFGTREQPQQQQSTAYGLRIRCFLS